MFDVVSHLVNRDVETLVIHAGAFYACAQMRFSRFASPRPWRDPILARDRRQYCWLDTVLYRAQNLA